jgi:hypothetical protein
MVIILLALASIVTGCGEGSSQESVGGRPAASGAVTAPEACSFSGTTASKSAGPDAPLALLTDVRVGTHGCFERVVFELRPQEGQAPGPLGYTVEYQPGPITEDGSGKALEVEGSAFLVVRLTAAGADLTKEDAPMTYTGPFVLDPAGTTRIRQVRRAGDFEGVVTWAIGLDKQRPFAVSTEEVPARLVVDVGDA